MNEKNKILGNRAENFVQKELDKCCVDSEIINTYYDIKTGEHQLIEVKSAHLTKRNGGNKRTTGRFTLSKLEYKNKQDLNNVWICFVVTHNEYQFILGLIESFKINHKTGISIHEVIETGSLSLGEFLEQTIFN